MKKILLLSLLATSAFASAPDREIFPSDYQPSACAADAARICQSYSQLKITAYAKTMRGFSLRQEWVDEHWEEMRAAFAPSCAKIASCYPVPGNDAAWCVDLMRDSFLATCDRFPKGSDDRDQCTMFAMTYYIGLGIKKELYQRAQSCAKGQPVEEEKTLEAWLVNDEIVFGREVELIVHAIDARTRVPVRATIAIDAGRADSTRGLLPKTGFPTRWRPTLKRVPNAEGHRDVVVPTLRVEAEGYTGTTLTLPITLSEMIVEMTPSADALKRGTNAITVTARDGTTGKPVRARVMAGQTVLGNTNQPLVLHWKDGEQLPEIWVTSLYDRYSDVVVSKATR